MHLTLRIKPVRHHPGTITTTGINFIALFGLVFWSNLTKRRTRDVWRYFVCCLLPNSSNPFFHSFSSSPFPPLSLLLKLLPSFLPGFFLSSSDLLFGQTPFQLILQNTYDALLHDTPQQQQQQQQHWRKCPHDHSNQVFFVHGLFTCQCSLDGILNWLGNPSEPPTLVLERPPDFSFNVDNHNRINDRAVDADSNGSGNNISNRNNGDGLYDRIVALCIYHGICMDPPFGLVSVPPHKRTLDPSLFRSLSIIKRPSTTEEYLLLLLIAKVNPCKTTICHGGKGTKSVHPEDGHPGQPRSVLILLGDSRGSAGS